jgi:cytosine deaminase
MDVTQAYAQTRWSLMNSADSRAATVDHLTVPKYGTFLFLYAPEPDAATGIMNLGAYGSTMEGPLPQTFPTNLQYVRPPRSGTVLDLTRVIGDLPPLYTQLVQVAVGPSPMVAQQPLHTEANEALSIQPLSTALTPRRPQRDHRLARHYLTYLHKAQNSRG